MSGYYTSTYFQDYKEHGFHGVLKKPFNLQELKNLLQENLQS